MEKVDTIIEKLIGQHRILQKELGGLLDLVKNEEIDNLQVTKLLEKFSSDLGDHLHLEDDIFYPELLTVMKSKDMDTLKTEDFINQMKDIGLVVIAFLQKYKEVAVIEENINTFKKELEHIVSVLNLRIESEEAGVYNYWIMYEQN